MEELFHKQIEDHFNYIKDNRAMDSSKQGIYYFAGALYRSVYFDLDRSILDKYKP